MRDGAFDIGMFRSYWERATKRTGERIADLSARPLQPSEEAVADGLSGGGLAPAGGQAGAAPGGDPVTHLSGLISRVLESADQLAGATRRSWKGNRVGSAESAPGDHIPE